MGFQEEWRIDPRKYLTTREVQRLRDCAQKLAGEPGRLGEWGVRAWMLIDLASQAGLRVQELADLVVGDVLLEEGRRVVLVRKGKCGKSRVVMISKELACHVRDFVAWKAGRGEPTTHEAPLLWSRTSHGAFSKRALQNMFKVVAERSLLPAQVSIHSLRHTYAIHLYKASKYNLRLVQKQLGHSSIKTTEVYADVFDADLQSAVHHLYKR